MYIYCARPGAHVDHFDQTARDRKTLLYTHARQWKRFAAPCCFKLRSGKGTNGPMGRPYVPLDVRRGLTSIHEGTCRRSLLSLRDSTPCAIHIRDEAARGMRPCEAAIEAGATAARCLHACRRSRSLVVVELEVVVRGEVGLVGVGRRLR